MHGLDVDAVCRRDVLQSARMYRGQLARRDRCKRPVVDIDKVRVCRGHFVPVERGICLRDGRPTCVRARRLRRRGIGRRVPRWRRRCRRRRTRRVPRSGCSASISTTLSTSALNSSVPIARSDPQIRVRARRAPRVAMTVTAMFAVPISATARIFAMWASRPCRTPEFTTRRRSSVEMSSASSSAIAAQSRDLKWVQIPFIHLACRVFRVRRLWLQFVEAGECGVQVLPRRRLRSG